MFTGLITDVGSIRAVIKGGDTRFEITTAFDTSSIDLGASIACNGVCLTAVELGTDWFAVEASAETLSKTTLGVWEEGTAVNLERSLRVGDELGGHIVSGHVDGTGVISSITPEGDSLRYQFEAPEALARYIAPKGSIAIDGVSLTVNEVEGSVFGINLIPFTQTKTAFKNKGIGDKVNLEIDVLARYVARMQDYSPSHA